MTSRPGSAGGAAAPATDDAPGGVTATDELLRAVVDEASLALLVMDPDGVVVFACGQQLRVPPDQLVGRSAFDMQLSDEEAAHLRRALRGEDVRHLTERGGRWWQVAYTPRRDGGAVQHLVATYHDVTDVVLAERASSDRERYLQAVVDAADEAIVVLDADTRVLMSNRRCRALFPGWAEPGLRVRDTVRGGAREAIERQLARRVAGHRDRYQLQVKGADGETVWLQVASSPLRRDDGSFAGAVAVLTDITATKLEELRQTAAARVDVLTGAATRLTLADRLEHALSRRSAGVVGVLFCDVDGLKAVNDRAGHAAGDALLKEVSRRITGALRPADTLARWGGDEFVVVCEELPHADEARHLAERVRAAVARTDGSGPLAVSIGVATAPPATSPEELLERADSAAYVAKRAGGDAVHVSG